MLSLKHTQQWEEAISQALPQGKFQRNTHTNFINQVCMNGRELDRDLYNYSIHGRMRHFANFYSSFQAGEKANKEVSAAV